MNRRLLIFLAAPVLVLALPAAAQFPDKPVTLLEGYPPGGLVDIVTRRVAESMKARFPKGLVIVNRPGAAGAVAVAEVARSQPDGYTIALTPASALVIAPQMHDLSYKTPDAVEPFINVVSYYSMVAVRTESPYANMRELVADAKANPGKVRIGTPGEGTVSHLCLEQLMWESGTKMVHVPFQGFGQSGPALLGGHLEAIVAQPGELQPQVEGKRMRVLAVFQPQRHPVFPDAPTARELGWDVVNGVWYLMIAPKGTPTAVLKYLHDSAKVAVDDPAFGAFMATRGVDVDYRPGDVIKADLLREYKTHTELLRRIGMIKT